MPQAGHSGGGRRGAISVQGSGPEPAESLPLCTSLPVRPLGAAPPLPVRTLGPRQVKSAPGSHGRGGMRTRGHLLLPFQHRGWPRRGPGSTVLPGSARAIGRAVPCRRWRTYFSLLNMMNSFRTVSKHCWRCPFCQRAERGESMREQLPGSRDRGADDQSLDSAGPQKAGAGPGLCGWSGPDGTGRLCQREPGR